MQTRERRLGMSRKGVIAFVSGTMVVVTQASLRAERVYQYEVTVNMPENDPGYDAERDRTTINLAIVLMNSIRPANPTAGDLGCIYVWPNPDP
jgi:hypothetical protein